MRRFFIYINGSLRISGVGTQILGTHVRAFPPQNLASFTANMREPI